MTCTYLSVVSKPYLIIDELQYYSTVLANEGEILLQPLNIYLQTTIRITTQCFLLIVWGRGGMSAWIIRYLGTGTSIQCVCLYTVLYVLLF